MLPIFLLVVVSLVQRSTSHGLPRAFAIPPTPSNIITQTISYTCLGLHYEGYAAIPKTPVPLARPGVLIGHTWTGLGKMEQYRAAQIASKLGVVAFALDVYGTGIRPPNQTAAKAEMDKVLANVTRFHQLLQCGMEQLKATTAPNGATVNTSSLFANGYCFGGVMVLELARRGTPHLQAVASFHGELANLTNQDTDKITAVVQVHHADLDFQGPTALLQFEDEMRSRNVTHWTTTKYGSVSHGWTDPTSANYRPFEAQQAHNNMFALYAQVLEMR
jgi:dienelactone hydrolase